MKLSTSIFAIALFTMNAYALPTIINDSSKIAIRFQPDSVLYVYENTGPEMPKQLYTAVIQNLAVINKSAQDITLTGISLIVKKGNSVHQVQEIPLSTIQASAAKLAVYQEHGLLELYDFQFQTTKYLHNIPLAANETIRSQQALIITHETLLFSELPDSIAVQVRALSENNEELIATKSLLIRNYKSKNSYIFPLKGGWLAAAAPSLIGHHRWGIIQEFAYDFIKTGENLKSHREDGQQLEHYYAYGQPVYAVAHGTVVSVQNTLEESAENIKKPGEDEESYLARTRPYQEKLMARGFQYIFGNHIVIRHDNNEYSAYFHLKTNSVPVKKGDKIKQGQLIGKLGHSGNSTEPHLHFHIADGEDILYARSLPVRFNNITLFPVDNGKINHLHSGQILYTDNE